MSSSMRLRWTAVRASSAATSSSRLRAGVPSASARVPADDVGDREERQPFVEECGDCDLVRCIEHSRDSYRPALRRWRACTSSGRLRRDPGGSNSRVMPAVTSRGGRRCPGARSRIGERVRDRHAHVRIAQGAQALRHREIEPVHEQSTSGARRRRCRHTAGRRGNAPRSARAPCSRASAESIVIFGPMFHVGCASASPGVTPSRSRALPPAERPTGGGEHEGVRPGASPTGLRGTGTPPSARCRRE